MLFATFASILIAQGHDPVFVSRRLGHANAAITLKVYAHLFDAERHASNAGSVSRRIRGRCSARADDPADRRSERYRAAGERPSSAPSSPPKSREMDGRTHRPEGLCPAGHSIASARDPEKYGTGRRDLLDHADYDHRGMR